MAEIDESEFSEEELALLNESDVPAEDITSTEEPGAAEPPAQPAAAEPAPAPAAEPQPVIQPQMVPLAALHEARNDIRALRQQLGSVDQLKAEILHMRRSLQPPPPSPEEDPFGATRHELNNVKEAIKLLAQNTVQRQQQENLLYQQAQQEQRRQQFVSSVEQAEAVFRQEAPDYDASLDYLRNLRRNEMTAMGITDPTFIENELVKMAWGVAAQAMQNGKSVPSTFYNLAKMYGYQKTPTAQQPAKGAPAPQPQSALPKQGQERFETIQRGQAAAKGLQTGEGDSSPSLKALLEADDEDFDKAWDSVFGKKRR